MAFISKVLPLLSCFIIAFVSSATCDAQSIIGKWKKTGTEIFVTDKATGKQTPASDQTQQQYNEHANNYTEILEFKANNTYVITTSTTAAPKPITHNGNYSLSGNELDMGVAPVNNEKPEITIKSLSSSTMVWSFRFKGNLMEITYTKS